MFCKTHLVAQVVILMTVTTGRGVGLVGFGALKVAATVNIGIALEMRLVVSLSLGHDPIHHSPSD